MRAPRDLQPRTFERMAASIGFRRVSRHEWAHPELFAGEPFTLIAGDTAPNRELLSALSSTLLDARAVRAGRKPFAKPRNRLTGCPLP